MDAARLVARALTLEDFYGFDEAADALIELKEKDKSLAGQVAQKILNDRVGDIYYQAFAFGMLYSISLDDAVSYMRSNALTQSPYVLGAMLDEVTMDMGAIDNRDKVFEAVCVLKGTLSLRFGDDLSSISEKITEFMNAYP